MLRYTTDRARPGLVALYDIRPGNGAGQFLQPQSPHGANSERCMTSGSVIADWWLQATLRLYSYRYLTSYQWHQKQHLANKDPTLPRKSSQVGMTKS